MFKSFKMWLGLKLINKRNALLDSELKWYLSSHKIEKLPAGSDVYTQNRFYHTISNVVIGLLETNCVVLNLSKRIDIDNGDTVITISYLDSHLFANLVNWAANNLKGNSGTDIGMFLESAESNKE